MLVIGPQLSQQKINDYHGLKKAAEGCTITIWRLPDKEIWTYDVHDKLFIEGNARAKIRMFHKFDTGYMYF